MENNTTQQKRWYRNFTQRKGRTWREIKRYYDSEMQGFEDVVDELKSVDPLLQEKFG